MLSRAVSALAFAVGAHSAEMDCSTIGAMIETVNTLCCNDGHGDGSHRRTQGNADCVLGACSAACAQTFVPMMSDCEEQLPRSDSGSMSIISDIPGADTFLASCQAVLTPSPPPGTHWINVVSWFGTADPGMQYSGLGGTGAEFSRSSGDGATGWGVWQHDPGPTGVPFSGITALESSGVAPAGWNFDQDSWWVEEHGRIMETPSPLPPGLYQVRWLNHRPGWTSTVVLTVTGDSWSLDSGATLYDVTHLPCRSAVYTTPSTGGSCSPDAINTHEFPVTPGDPMPSVPGCDKLDYAVLFIKAYWG
eukprot:COSAG05_NODE_29_length_29038_cov_1237.466985_17_plen_305_part_00